MASMGPIQPVELTGALLRAARTLAGIRAEELARETGLGLATIKRAEAAPGAPLITASNRDRILEAYARRGIDLVSDGDRAGVLVIRR